MNYAIEFYKRNGKRPTIGRHDFAEAGERVLRMKFDAALKWLQNRGKKLKITTSWNEISDAGHSKAFTVSTVMKADILQEIYNVIEQARIDGMPFSEFKQTALKEGGLAERMTAAGWTGGASPSRLKVIYNTNLTIAHAKGQHEQMLLLSKERPLWKYKQLQRVSKRHEHARYHNKVFRNDDPIWDSIYPPRDFNCGCTVIAVKEADEISDGKNYKVDYDQNINPFGEYEPDTTAYADRIKDKLERALYGEQ